MRKLLNITKETEVLTIVESTEVFLIRFKGLLDRYLLDRGQGL